MKSELAAHVAEIDRLVETVSIVKQEFDKEVRFDENARENLNRVWQLLVDCSKVARSKLAQMAEGAVHGPVARVEHVATTLDRTVARVGALLADDNVDHKLAILQASESIGNMQRKILPEFQAAVREIADSSYQEGKADIATDLLPELREWLARLERERREGSGAGVCEATRMILSIGSIAAAYSPEVWAPEMAEKTIRAFEAAHEMMDRSIERGEDPDGQCGLYHRNVGERLQALRSAMRHWCPAWRRKAD